MPIGAQPFDFPINAVKKETSIANKVLVKSHDEQIPGIPTWWDFPIDRRIHTQSIKIKFFIVGYRLLSETKIHYIGNWVELEESELVYWPPTAGIPNTFMVGFYPYINEPAGLIVPRLQIFPLPDNDQKAELYIEKVTVVDSDFDSELSWLTDPDIPPFEPQVTGPLDPDYPYGINPDPNNNWIWNKSI